MDSLWFLFLPYAHPAILAGGTLAFFFLSLVWYSRLLVTGRIWKSHHPDKVVTIPGWQEKAPEMIGHFLLGYIFVHTIMMLWSILSGIPELLSVKADMCQGLSCDVYNNKADSLLNTLIIFLGYLGMTATIELARWLREETPFSLILIEMGFPSIGILTVCATLSIFL